MLLKISYPCIGGLFVLSAQIGAVQRLGSNRGIQFYQNLRDFTYRADVTDFSYIRFFIIMYRAGLRLLLFKECLRNNIVRLCLKNVGFSMCFRVLLTLFVSRFQTMLWEQK